MEQETATLNREADGTPPGLDRELYGKEKMLEFSGHFFAQPAIPFQRFRRRVVIAFASREIYVAYDPQLQSLYVVDRLQTPNLSLGCRMNAELFDIPEGMKVVK